MHARLARYALEPDRVDDALAAIREAGREIAVLDGFRGGQVMVDHDRGR